MKITKPVFSISDFTFLTKVCKIQLQVNNLINWIKSELIHLPWRLSGSHFKHSTTYTPGKPKEYRDCSLETC